MTDNEGSAESQTAERRQIFISYKRAADPDGSIAAFLHERLASLGYSVFIDIEIPPGSDWSEVISSKITRSDFFVVLLSRASVRHGYVVAETVMANDKGDIAGHPKILPVRLAYADDLPLQLSGVIGHLHHFEWRDHVDSEPLLATLLRAIGEPKLPVKPTALVRGDHWIITGRMWQSPGTRESLAGTTIVPVRPGQPTHLAVTRTDRPGLFAAKVLDDGGLEVAIWKGTEYRGVTSQPGVFIEMLQGDSHGWCFAQYMPDQAVLLKRPDGRKDPVVVTFDQDLVRAAWMIRHEHGANRESFLIVTKDSSAR